MKLRALIHPLLMIIALAIVFSLYGAWYSYVGKTSANAVSLASQVEGAKLQRAHARESQQELARVSLDETAIREYFVNPSNVVAFLESLQRTGTELGSTVEVVSVSAEPTEPHAHLLLSLKITGPFSSVERTLGAIEYQPYDTTVQNLTLDTTGSGDGAGDWTAAVTLTVGTLDSASASSTQP